MEYFAKWLQTGIERSSLIRWIDGPLRQEWRN
jgi:hypothetical protein